MAKQSEQVQEIPISELFPKQVVKDFLIKFTEKPQKKCQEALSCS